MNVFQRIKLKLFGDKRVRHRGCNHCLGRGCTFLTREQIDSGKAPSNLVGVTMQGKLSVCHASIYEVRDLEREETMKRLRRALELQKLIADKQQSKP